MKSILVPPFAPTLMESTRSIGYSLEAAVADVIDNSIAASASRVDISFYPIGSPYIAILDNGTGMNEIEINQAMQYGSKSPIDERSEGDLGRFGLGLKTASLSQCRSLTVVSNKEGRLEARKWDIDHVMKTGEWSLIVLDEKEIESLQGVKNLMEYESGTLVVWEKLDRLSVGEISFENSIGRKMDEVRKHLALVYHRYLAGESGIKKVDLYINNVKVSPQDPFLQSKSHHPMDDEVLMVRGKRVVIKPYILPHISKLSDLEIAELGGKDGLRKHQGFYIYRNRRLLVWGTWFRMMRKGDLSKLARIQVDIPNALDDLWTLDIKKSSAIPPAELRKSLQAVIENMSDVSKRTWTYRGKKETTDSLEHTWSRCKTHNGGIFYEINRDHPLINSIFSAAPGIRQQFNALLRQIEQSIPLNQLYVDLNNDEKLENELNLGEAEIDAMLSSMLKTMPSKSAKMELLEKMASVEPFNNYPDVVRKFMCLEVSDGQSTN